jgi:hypothetical protein
MIVFKKILEWLRRFTRTRQVRQMPIETDFEALLSELQKVRSSRSIISNLRMEGAELSNKSLFDISTSDLENLLISGVDTYRFSEKLSKIIRRQPLEVPFFTTDETQGLIAIRFQRIDTAIEQAVRNNHVVLVPQVALYDTCPVLCLAVIIYDLKHPYVAEGFSMIDGGDVQDFLKQVIVQGGGEIRLYSQGGRLSVKGLFKLQAPQTYKWEKGTFPIPSTDLDRIYTITIVRAAANHLEAIPQIHRDFNTASQQHMSSVPEFQIFGETGIRGA